MLWFSAPFALFSLVALTIPLVIHLLHRRPGKRIKVGSIKFLQESQRHRFKSFRLHEVPLLLLRAALVAILAMLLAQPFWVPSDEAFRHQGASWALLSSEALEHAQNFHLRDEIDSLKNAGYELRIFAPGFPPLTSYSAPQKSNETEDYWSLLRELDAILPDSSRIVIFAPNSIKHFRGERPALRTNMVWRAIPNSEPKQWIAEARWLGQDSLLAVAGFSEARQTFFAREVLQATSRDRLLTGEKLPPLSWSRADNGGQDTLRFLQRAAAPRENSVLIEPAREIKHVAIIHDEQRSDDARYVQAALAAAAEFGHLPIRTNQLQPDQMNEAMNSDFIFWLSEQAVPTALLEQTSNGATLIRDAASKQFETVERKIVMSDDLAQDPPRLARRIAVPNNRIVLWRDDAGEALLSCERIGTGSFYHYASRFHPLWSELVHHAAFPQLMLHILKESESKSHWHDLANDQRAISLSQIMPHQDRTLATSHANAGATSLHLPFWIAALVLFALERWLAERRTA
ncbi:MAG: hypothetical protein DYG95_29425 [Chlorobi bacterium CHB1]|nr:hypothetical protein [Chlorobi bacterium CHB1]